MKRSKMLLAAAFLLFACQAGAADGILGWNTTKKDWVKIRASASGFMFSGQDANDYITLYSATTATTGAKPQVALPLGAYRVRATVTGTGTVTGTVEMYCNNTDANTGGTQYSTDITLNDTTTDTDVLASDITTACPWGYIEVDAVSADTAMTVVAIPILAPTGAGSSSTSPAYVGGIYNATLPTLSNGNTTTLQFNSRGLLRTIPGSASGDVVVTGVAADDLSSANLFLGSASVGLLFDGSNFDRLRGDSTGGAWVQGPAAVGATAAGNPVLFGVVDGNGHAQYAAGATDGDVNVRSQVGGADVSAANPVPVGSGDVRTLTIAAGMTSNTTSALVAAPAGTKTFYGRVTCSSGACTQTQAIYGDQDDDSGTDTDGILLCTLTLSGTPTHQDACPATTANFPYFYVVTTNTTGTSASGDIYANY